MSFQRQFAGRVALVTGGGRGLGRAIALELARRSAAVAVCARSASEVAEVERSITAAGGKGVAVVADVTSAADIERCVKEVKARFGPVDTLVNCAGVFRYAPSIEAPVAEFRDTLDTNVVGTFAMCQAVGRGMLEAGRGKIVNFASLLSFTGFPERAAYAASKGGVLQLTRVLGIEWARHGVNVNAIAPGMIAIETPHPAIEKGTLSSDAIVHRIPAGRRGMPGDVVGPTLFLLSSEADYVVGQTLVVDGGWLSNGYV